MEGHESAWGTFMLFVGSGVGTFFIGLFSAIRKPKEGAETATSTSVVAASVISDKGLEKLILAVRESAESHHDDTRRVREEMSDLGECMRDLTRAVREGLPPVAAIDVAGIMARLNKVERGT